MCNGGHGLVAIRGVTESVHTRGKERLQVVSKVGVLSTFAARFSFSETPAVLHRSALTALRMNMLFVSHSPLANACTVQHIVAKWHKWHQWPD